MKGLQNNFTTLEQSNRLLELGVPEWTADLYMFYTGRTIVVRNNVYERRKDFFTKTRKDGYKPVWSAGRLIEISLICGIDDRVPNELYINKYSLVGSLVENIISRLERVADLNVNDIDFSKLEE